MRAAAGKSAWRRWRNARASATCPRRASPVARSAAAAELDLAVHPADQGRADAELHLAVGVVDGDDQAERPGLGVHRRRGPGEPGRPLDRPPLRAQADGRADAEQLGEGVGVDGVHQPVEADRLGAAEQQARAPDGELGRDLGRRRPVGGERGVAADYL